MLLVSFILICTSIRSFQAYNFTKNDNHDLMATWHIKRVQATTGAPGGGGGGKAQIDKIKKKFPDEGNKAQCDSLHKTDIAPFTAIILFKTSGRLLCMGSIIDEQHVLTCRRCYDKTDAPDLRVVVGYAKPWWGEHAQVKKVEKIIRHEYEVAILKLMSKVKFTEYIQAAKLPSPTTKVVTEFHKVFGPPYYVVGFFVDRFDVPGDFLSKEKIYQMKEDQLVKIDECKKNYTKIALEKAKLFCTLGNATYCWGGWGAPVLKKTTPSTLQVGIVIADNCTSTTTGPFLVARTDSFGEWIRGNSRHGHQPS